MAPTPVTAPPTEASGSSQWIVARQVAQFAVLGLAAVVIVALATATASSRVGQREAITDARTTTLIKAQGLVEPVVTDRLMAGDPAAVAAVAEVVEGSVLDASLVRVKIWDETGTIVYSDEHSLVGQRFTLEADELDAMRSGLIKADVTDLKAAENRQERAFGKLLQVYLPIRTPGGTRLLFEAYYRYDAVSRSGRRIWSSFAPVSIGALVALELLQVPLAWSLARRLRQRQREREALLQRAVESSDVERRRIATDLHDGVVQELVGVAFGLAGSARDDEVPDKARRALDEAAAVVRASISELRSSLVDIYPPDLTGHGLRAALHELAADASTDDLTVSVDVPRLSDRLPAAVAALLYRASREALRNVVRHAGASSATVRAGSDRSWAWAEVSDDGAGFDPSVLAARAAEGHLGLRGLEGVVGDAGGTFGLDSAPGRGTTVRVEVPLR